MRLRESTSKRIAERLNEAMRKKTDDEEIGETGTRNLCLISSWKSRPGWNARSERPAMAMTNAGKPHQHFTGDRSREQVAAGVEGLARGGKNEGGYRPARPVAQREA
jgi:hypothetical protein